MSPLRRAARCLMLLCAAGVADACLPSPRASAPAATAPAVVVPGAAAAAFDLRPGDRIVLLGNGLAERMQHDGWLETLLHARLPRHRLSLRNLGFAGDTLTVQQRTDGFGSWSEWLTFCRADVVFACFGFNESFAGAAGLAAFRADLERFIDDVSTVHSSDGGPPRLVLFTPAACEDLPGRPLPKAATHHARLRPYVDAMLEVGAARGVPCVDLFTSMSDADRSMDGEGPLTIDGVHFTGRGNAALAARIAPALLPGPLPEPGAEADLAGLRAAVQEKDRLWFRRYRVTDGYNVYGGRSALEYDGLSNATVLRREMEILDARCEQADRRIWALAGGAEALAGAPPPPPVPAPIPVPTNRPGPGPDGRHLYLGGEEALALMGTGPGLEIGLFADEAAFPDLINPVQMSFDTAGRLWVATWPSYPHRAPDQPTTDQLLILEDQDGDGRADRSTVFASDLHNPTGFEFWNGGVLVAAAPDLLFLEDTDGDDRADRSERLLHGLSSSDTHHTANSFVIGPDGALYFQEGIFHHSQIESVHGVVANRDACVWRFEPRSGRVERYIAYGFLNPHGHVFDRWGQDFVTDGTGNENFFALPMSGRVDFPGTHATAFPFFEQRSRPAAATEILSSRHFPPVFQGNYLIANVIGFQGVFRYALRDDGSGFTADEQAPIVHSADPNFRPVDLEVGPDGALYLLDWHNALIGHMQHHIRDPSRDRGHGRVYRVTAAGRPLGVPAPIAGRPVAELLELLKSGEDRVQYRVRIELGGRPVDEVVAATRTWVAGLDPSDPDVEHQRLAALWVQAQHGVLDLPLLLQLLDSPVAEARAAALRQLRHSRAEVAAGAEPLDLLRRAVADDHPRVRLEAVVALSFLDELEAAEAALLALSRPMDRFLDYALQETMRTLEPHWRADLRSGGDFAADAPAGLAWALARLTSEELTHARPSLALDEERLARPGLAPAEVLAAGTRLAQARGRSTGAELLAAISRADARDDDHVDHLLSGLFAGLAEIPAASRSSLSPALAALGASARRDSTGRLARAARMEADGSIEPAWNDALAAAAALVELVELLEAAPLLREAKLAEALFPRVEACLDGPAADAAARCLASLGVRPGDAVTALARRFDDPARRPALAAALATLPAAHWPAEATDRVAGALLSLLAAPADAGLPGAASRDLLALAELLAPRLGGDRGERLARLCADQGPQVVVIRPLPDSLLFDRAEFSVVAGRPVELTFENVDLMPHNLLLAAPGALAKVGLAAERMAADPGAWAAGFVPDLPEVLTATGLLKPGESQTLRFTAPAAPGDYPFVCTFPGHWMRMNGIMRVVSAADAASVTAAAPGPLAAAPGAAARRFVRDWRVADLLPDLGDRGDRGDLDRASAERGRAVFEAASCQRCHRTGDAALPGQLVGPDLQGVAQRHGRRELLAQVLEPSLLLAEGFRSEVFVTTAGRVLSGRVVAEDEQSIQIQDNPYSDVPLRLPRAEIAERWASELSAMPEGLLSTFEREEILDLLAYLESLVAGAGGASDDGRTPRR